ncbi:DUF2141 domain-containing protein [Falsiroseomonas sp. E2-1-a20]|uniref:DUF2141 domain-containing protein n=1 Tax=Falsiroseomonas sp. E2-1-a20 TaxID=3239300 RepID=UPI003F31EBA4
MLLRSLLPATLLLLAAGAGSSGLRAAELRVAVTGATSTTGQVGCALYAGEAGFPTDAASAIQLWQPANPAGVTCRFENLRPGSYAVAASHDVNGNRRTDTNFFGIPTEDWGVSNNVRPTLRAPRFNEAAVQVPDGAPVAIEIRLGR